MKPTFRATGVVAALVGASLAVPAADISGTVLTRGKKPIELATVTARWGASENHLSHTNKTVTDADGEYTLSIAGNDVFVELRYAARQHRPAFWRTNLPPDGAVHSEELIPTPWTLSTTGTADEVGKYWMSVAAQASSEGTVTALWEDLDRRSAGPLDKAYLARGLKSRTVALESLGRAGKEIEYYSTTDVDKIQMLNRRIAAFINTTGRIPNAPLCAAWVGQDEIPKLVIADSIGDNIAIADPASRPVLYGDFTKEWGSLRLENDVTGSIQLDGIMSGRIGSLDALKATPK